MADHDVPHFHIRDNLTRGRDGETAGEKRRARRRVLPIHQELIRLGFLDYVEAIRAEGSSALFPELYVNAEKRGGAHFYERAWQHMVAYIGAGVPLPVNAAGKGPDIHSIRGLGSSFYEVDGVNELMRADVMGHAREGTNGKHYSKRMATEGLDVVLAERRAFLERYVPVITGHSIRNPSACCRSRSGLAWAASARARREPTSGIDKPARVSPHETRAKGATSPGPCSLQTLLCRPRADPAGVSKAMPVIVTPIARRDDQMTMRRNEPVAVVAL